MVDASVDSGGSGVLLAIDEFHNITPTDASFVSGALQEIVKIDQKPLVFVAAGLPHIEHTLLTDEGFTFFHRCHRDRVASIDLQDAMEAIGRPLTDNSFFSNGPQLRRAAAATRGLGYAVQSLGHHLWKIDGPPPAEITNNQIHEAITLMENDVDTHVVVPIWSRLSPADKRFLCAMVEDDGPSRIADIAARLGTAATSAPVYRQRTPQTRRNHQSRPWPYHICQPSHQRPRRPRKNPRRHDPITTYKHPDQRNPEVQLIEELPAKS